MNVVDSSGWVEYTTDEENMADSLILATARVYNATFSTERFLRKPFFNANFADLANTLAGTM